MAGNAEHYNGVFSRITQQEAEEAQMAISNGGMATFTEFLKRKKDNWKEVPLNVGFIGNSGVGKSSTINSILGLSPGENGAAEVGTCQTTMEPTAYIHPSNDKLIMWDLPGVGTPSYPKDRYFKEIGFKRYDFFLLLDAGRFREEDAWIGKEIKNLEKDYFYVRTKIDNDVDNNRHDKGWDRDQTMEEVKSNIIKNMEEQGMDQAPVYLISNRHLAEYDFPRLLVDLVSSFPAQKRGALALCLRALSTDMTHFKVAELKKRIIWCAMLSAGAAAVPIPGAGLVVDLAILAEELTFYYNQLGLTEKQLKKLGSETGANLTDLLKVAGNLYPASFLTSTCVREALFAVPALVVGTALEEAALFIPAIGSVVAAGLSLGTTAWFLNSSLNKMEKAATAVLKEAIKQHVSL